MAPLTDELAHVEAEIRRLETIRDYLRSRAAQSNGATPRPRGPRPPQQGRVTAAAAAEEVLAGRGEPMRTPDLLAAIRLKGAKMADTDSLYKTLSRSPKFRKAGRGLWELA